MKRLTWRDEDTGQVYALTDKQSILDKLCLYEEAEERGDTVSVLAAACNLEDNPPALIVSDRMKAPPNVNVRNVVAEDYAQAADAIEELSKPKWISVEEKLAEWPCIVYDANGNLPFIPHGILTITDAQGTWQIDARLADSALHQGKIKPVLGYGNRITHWMPLPSPPNWVALSRRRRRTDG